MKKIVLSTLVAASVLFSGCGSDEPQEVAVKFVKALSSGDTQEAIKLGSDDTDESIKNVMNYCNKDAINKEVEKLQKEAKEVKQKFEKKLTQVRKDDKINKKMEEIEKKYKQEMEALQHKIKTEMFFFDPENRYVKEMQQLLPNMVKKSLEVGNIDISDHELDLLSISFSPKNTRRESIQKLAQKNIEEAGIKTPIPCIQKRLHIKEIDDINVLEVKEGKNADQSTIRVEVVFGDDKSEKYDIRTEKIQKEWQVSSMPFGG